MTDQENANTETLDQIINVALSKLADAPEGSDEFTKIVNQIKELYKIKETIADIESTRTKSENETLSAEVDRLAKQAEVELKQKDIALKDIDIENSKKAFFWKLPVKTETLVPILGSLAGILIVVAYEHTHIVTSKALGAALRKIS